MISSAPAGFKTLSLGDQFAAARGNPADVSMFDTAMAPAPVDTLSVNPVPAPVIDPMGFFAGKPGREETLADPVKLLQDRLQAATNNTSGTWKAADKVRPDSVIKGVEGMARSHGEQTKGATAQDMKTAQVAEIKSILKEMSALGVGPVAQGPGGSSGGFGKAAGNFAADALMTAGATALLGPVGGIVATGMMAARAGVSSGLEGQGTLVTFDKPSGGPGYFASAYSSSRKHGKDSMPIDYGYGSSPSVTPQAASAPVSNAFDQRMSKGPGFGRADILADSKMPGQTFDQIAIKIAADSPAGMAIESMRRDSVDATSRLRSQRDGVDANAENMNAALEIGMKPPEQGIKIPTFKMV